MITEVSISPWTYVIIATLIIFGILSIIAGVMTFRKKKWTCWIYFGLAPIIFFIAFIYFSIFFMTYY